MAGGAATLSDAHPPSAPCSDRTCRDCAPSRLLVVVLDHLFGWPSGGFIGVDVFFVISGFLITGLLLREYERHRPHLVRRASTARRVKRIMPAAVLVLVVDRGRRRTGPVRSRALHLDRHDAIWSLLLRRQLATSPPSARTTSQAPGPVSAASALLVAVRGGAVLLRLAVAHAAGLRPVPARTSRGSGNGARIAVGIAIVVMSLASFAWAMRLTASNPTLAYFSTFTRGWELGVGAALAVIAPLAGTPPRAVAADPRLGGADGMTASLFLITPRRRSRLPGLRFPCWPPGS